MSKEATRKTSIVMEMTADDLYVLSGALTNAIAHMIAAEQSPGDCKIKLTFVPHVLQRLNHFHDLNRRVEEGIDWLNSKQWEV
jgi:hypothetical protein